MEGLIQLTDGQFSLVKEGNVNVMRCTIPGIVFIMFKTTRCEYSKEVTPILNHLAKHDLRIKWGVANLTLYKNISMMSKSTTTIIKGVPTFILYVNGRPHINYKGKRNLEHIAEFVNKALSSIGNVGNTRFVPQEQFIEPQRREQRQEQSRFPKSSRAPPQQKKSRGKDGAEAVDIPSKITPHNAPYLAYADGHTTAT